MNEEQKGRSNRKSEGMKQTRGERLPLEGKSDWIRGLKWEGTTGQLWKEQSTYRGKERPVK
jgi:outer membrane biogenesis lipoprotein LolB